MWRGYNYMRTDTYTYTQLQGPQGHLRSDRSHCKEAAVRTMCQSPPTHIIVSQNKSFTLHMLTARHFGLKERRTKCLLVGIDPLCAVKCDYIRHISAVLKNVRNEM